MRRAGWVVAACIALFAAEAWAHDLQVAHESSGSVTILRCRYADAEPAAYASVLIFSPADAKSEFQNGRTAASGTFAFVPDRPGEWRAIVDDEIGHRVEHRMTIAEAGGGNSSATAPRWQNIVTGLAIIAGLTGVAYGRQRRATPSR